jgi:hypothetical protein
VLCIKLDKSIHELVEPSRKIIVESVDIHLRFYVM